MYFATIQFFLIGLLAQSTVAMRIDGVDIHNLLHSALAGQNNTLPLDHGIGSDGNSTSLSNLSTVSLIQRVVEYELNFNHKHSEATPINKWLLCIIVAFNFGLCGVDRCLFGQIGLGVAKGFTCGGCCIWAIIDWWVLVINILGMEPKIDFFGFQGTFEADTIMNAFYVMLGALIWFFFSYLCQPIILTPMAKACARRNVGSGAVGHPSALEIQIIFDSYDADKSGALDKEEFYKAMVYLGISDEMKMICEKLVDADGDGKISCSEFASAFEKHLLKEPGQ